MATQEKVKLPVIYTSRRESDEFRGPRAKNLRLIRVPSYPKYDGNGEPAGFTPELVYEFQDGLLVVNEQMVERDVHFFEERARDRKLDFEGYSAEDTVRWLEEHEDFGLDFVRQPDVAPPAGPLLKDITMAALEGDLSKLVRIHEEEDGSFARPEVLEPCLAAISRLEEIEEEQRAAAERAAEQEAAQKRREAAQRRANAQGQAGPSEPPVTVPGAPQGPVAPE